MDNDPFGFWSASASANNNKAQQKPVTTNTHSVVSDPFSKNTNINNNDPFTGWGQSQPQQQQQPQQMAPYSNGNPFNNAPNTNNQQQNTNNIWNNNYNQPKQQPVTNNNVNLFGATNTQNNQSIESNTNNAFSAWGQPQQSQQSQQPQQPKPQHLAKNDGFDDFFNNNGDDFWNASSNTANNTTKQPQNDGWDDVFGSNDGFFDNNSNNNINNNDDDNINDDDDDDDDDNNNKKNKKKKKKKKKKNKKNVSQNIDKNYDSDVVEELYQLGYGSKKQIRAASAQCVNFKDINEVSDKVNELKIAPKDDLYDDIDEYKNKKEFKWNSYSMMKSGDQFTLSFASDTKKAAGRFNDDDFQHLDNVLTIDEIYETISSTKDNGKLKVYENDLYPNTRDFLVDVGGEFTFPLPQKDPNDSDSEDECVIM